MASNKGSSFVTRARGVWGDKIPRSTASRSDLRARGRPGSGDARACSPTSVSGPAGAGPAWAAPGRFWGGKRCRSARAGCLDPVVGSAMIFTIKVYLVNIRTSSEPPRDDPPRCCAVSYLRSHPPPRDLPRRTQPTKTLSVRPSGDA